MSEETLPQLPPELSREERLEQMLAEYLRQMEQGEHVDQQALLAAHPDLADDLSEFFGNQLRMQRLVGAAPAPHNGTPSKLRYFGDYEILEVIAHGGMGMVYKARQTSLNRVVAVKMILAGQLANESDVKRFQAEAEAAANLHHPGVVGIYEVGVQDGQHYYSMEFVEGRDLSAVLRERPVGTVQAAEYLREIAEIVEFAHSQGVLHRDLKPSNILIDAADRLRITDFGLAKRVQSESDLTMTGQVLGTPSYMSPEQAAAQHVLIGPASDVYSLGTILYEMLTGRPPFRSENIGETLRQVQQEEPVRPRLLNPKLPRDLETICLKCLEKESRRRYASAQHLADELGRFLRGEPILARPIGPLSRTWRWCRRKPLVAALSAVSALAIAVTIGVLIYSREIIATALSERTTALSERTTALTERTTALSKLEVEQGKTVQALAHEKEALKQKTAALKRERITAYAHTLTLARREWLEGNLVRALELLNACHPDLRHWEWHYLRRLCDPPSLFTAASAVSSSNRLPITLDGQDLLLYHAAADGLAVTNASTGATTPKFGGPARNLFETAVSRDGQVILSSGSLSRDQVYISKLELRNTQSGQSLFKADLMNFQVDCIAVNHDGSLWAAGGGVMKPVGAFSWTINAREVRVWKREASDTPLKLLAMDGPKAVMFSPDGTRLVAVLDGGFDLWETVNFTHIAADRIGYQPCHPCFRWDGVQFASATGDSIHVYDTVSGDKIRTYKVAKKPVTAVAYGDGDRKLAYGTADGNLVLLDLDSGKEVILFRLPQKIRQLEFSPDGQRLVTLDVTPDGKGRLRIWDAKVRSDSATISGQAKHHFTTAFEPSGQLVASVSDHNSVQIQDIASQEIKQELPGFSGEIYDATFSAAKTRLATVSTDGVEVWNLETGARMFRFVEASGIHIALAGRPPGPRPPQFRQSVTFARRDSWLIGSHERGATIWDLTTGAEVRSFGVTKNSEPLFSARLTADARRLATCGHDGQLQLWDSDTGRELFQVEEENTLYSLTFSPDEKQIVTCGDGKEILIVDAKTGREVRRLSGHARGANTVAFSSDGKRLVSAGCDGMIKIWEAETGLELLSFQGNDETCYSATFSPDCRRLITTEAGLLRIWDAGVSPFDPKVRREMAAAHNALAAEFMAGGRFLDAEEAFDQAREVLEKLAADFPKETLYRDDLIHSQWSLGTARQSGGRLTEAELSFSKAIDLNPTASGVWLRRAEFFASQQKVQKADADYTQALTLDPKNATVHNTLAWMLATCPEAKLRNPKRSVELARKGVELSPGAGEIWNTLGVAQYRAGDWREAIKTLTKSMELRNQGDSSEYFFLAMSHENMGEKEMARKWYDKGVSWLEKNQPQNDEFKRFRTEAAQLLGLKK